MKIAKEFGDHPNNIHQWQQHSLEMLPKIFSNRRSRREKWQEELESLFCQQIGQLKMELEWPQKISQLRLLKVQGFVLLTQLVRYAMPLAVVAFAFGMVSCRRLQEPTWRVKFSHVYAVKSDYQKLAERFRDLMAERTGGRFLVIIYPSGQLGDERASFEQLQFGAQEMAISGTPVLSAWVPEGQVFDLPYLFISRDQGLAALNGHLGDWWRKLLLKKTGIRALGFLDYGFRHVYNCKRPIEHPGDLKGLKLRVLQNATYLAAYESFGVQATPMAYGEVYSALQQGVIDGGEANVIGYVTDRFYEVAPYFSFTAITYNPITLLISERFYESLPSDVRNFIELSAAEALSYQSQLAREMEKQSLEEMKHRGVSICYPSIEEFAPTVKPTVWDTLAMRLPNGRTLLEWIHKEVDQGILK